MTATPAPESWIDAGFGSFADALFDALTLTCHMRFAAPLPGGVEGLRERLGAAGIIGRTRGGRSEVTFRVECPRTAAVLEMGGSLSLKANPQGGAIAGGSSKLDLNLLRLLRQQLQPDCGEGLDGGLNLVGQADEDRPELLSMQLETVSTMLDDFLRECRLAAGVPVSMQLWVRVAEVNRDLARTDAPELAHRLAGEANPWHRLGWARHYAGAADTEYDGNLVAVTWRNDRADAPIRMKTYAKTAGLLRTEICLDNREAVLLAVSNGGCELPAGPSADGAGIFDRLTILAWACVPLLDAMAAHTARLDAPQKALMELLVALAPVMRTGAMPPAARAGGRPGRRTQLAVCDALFHLLVMGRYDASGLRANSTVRKALRRVAQEGGLLYEPRGRAALYTLDPSFARARAALRVAMWPEMTEADRQPSIPLSA